MTEEPVNQEPKQEEYDTLREDIYIVRVNDPGQIYRALVRTGYPLYLSGTDLNSALFKREETNVRKSFSKEGEARMDLFSRIELAEERVKRPDRGYYDAEEIESIALLLRKRGLDARVVSRTGNIRNLSIETNGTSVMVDLGAETTEADWIFRDKETEAIPNYLSSEQRENNFILMFPVDKKTLVEKELKVPVLPASEADFGRFLADYVEIYQSFLNVMMSHEGERAPATTIEFKAPRRPRA